MALRKEDLDADDEQRDNAKKRSRITIDLSPELRRRIKLAALQNDLPIGEYVKHGPKTTSTRNSRGYRAVT